MASFLDGINRTKVTPELLIEVVQMHTGMPAEDRGVFEVRTFRVFELLKSKGLRARKIAGLAAAIDCRLTALARLERDAALRGWTMPGLEAGAVSISTAVLEAAAKEPLIEDAEGQAAFDMERFRRRLLRSAEPEGRA
jgi:hypothetical protein